MIVSANPSQAAPHQYRATGDVTATRRYYRDRLGRFAANPTARAMRHVRWLWQVGEWKAMTNSDSPGDEPAAA